GERFFQKNPLTGPNFGAVRYGDRHSAALSLTGEYEQRWCTNRNWASAPPLCNFSQVLVARDSGIPRSVSRFRMLQAITAFTNCVPTGHSSPAPLNAEIEVPLQ
ncbi:MAG: hypothetical protein OSA40_13790, partial [Phycisphaerales bacterium]|nr:hypothetical protein [Phycisphaerales bacterium]